MRTLGQITDAVRRNEPVSEKELRYAVCAYDVLLAKLEVENSGEQMHHYMEAAALAPDRYVGPANDPARSEVVEWHRKMGAFKNPRET